MADQSYQTDDVKLREYLEVLLAEHRRYFETRLTAIEQATDLARSTMSQRLDAMNEIRAALKDQSGLMMTRTEMSVIVERLRTEVDDLKKRSHVAEGKASQTSVIFFGFLSVASLLISLIKLLMG